MAVGFGTVPSGRIGLGIVLAVGVAAMPVRADGGDETRLVVIPGAAVIRMAEGAVFERADGAAGAEGFAGTLVAGTIEAAALEPVVLRAAGRELRLDPGIARIGADGDSVRVCAGDGAVTIDATITVAPNTCAAVGPAGVLPLAPEEAHLDVLPLPPLEALPPFADDPFEAVERVAEAGRAGDAGDEGEGGSTETGGAAACLDTAGTGPEAASPEGTELPETEIDRSRHRLHVEVTLDGY